MLHLYPPAPANDYLSQLQPGPAIEPTIFNHPAFLQPALSHLAGKNCRLLRWQNQNDNLILPVQIKAPGLGWQQAICNWQHPYSTQGTPFITTGQSPQCLPQLLEQFLAELGRPDHHLPDLLVLQDIPLDAAIARELTALASQRNLPLQQLQRTERPVLQAGNSAEDYLTQAISKHHYRDYRRLWRRLAERGALTYQISRERTAIAEALEDFLQLEAAGWKGRAGTALLSRPHHAAFTRQAIANLAAQQQVRMHMLRLDDRVIASLITFYAQDQAWTWKTAYDETLRAFSPGTLLMIELIKNHLADPLIRCTDSCAIADHPVMSRLFQQRQTFGTLVLGLTPHSQSAVATICRQIEHYNKLATFIRRFKQR